MGQCAATPRSTSGRVEFSTLSGSAPGSAPVTSSMVSARGGIESAGALDQVAEMRERGDHHEDRLQITLRMQLAERLCTKARQLLFADGVEADEAVLRTVAELDVEREGLEQ